MYFLYCRLDIDALWFKLETSKSLSFEPMRLIGLVSLGDFENTKTNPCFILNRPQRSHTLVRLSILFFRLGTNSLGTLLGSLRPARSSLSSNTTSVTRTILATFLPLFFARTSTRDPVTTYCDLPNYLIDSHSSFKPVCNFPGPSIFDYTQQLFGPSEFSALVTNKLTFGINYKMGQALTPVRMKEETKYKRLKG